MIYLIMVGLFIFVWIQSFQIISYRKELKRLSSKLNELDITNTNEKLNMNIQSKPLYELIKSINHRIDVYKKDVLEIQLREREIKQTITNLSHDLRTPLTSIFGYLQLIDKTDDIKEREEYLVIITKKVKILKMLLDELFEFSIVSSSEYEIHMESVHVHWILTDVLSHYYEDIQSKFKDPKISLCEEDEQILGDRTHLKRIFSNLIENALKHGEDQLKINSLVCDGHIHITISNKVSDLNEKDGEKLFDRFFRTEYSRSTQGSGLGLNIAKKLAVDMNGEIRLFMSKEKTASQEKSDFLNLEVIFPLMNLY